MITNKAQLLDRKIVRATVEYREGPWGRATQSRKGAARLSERGSLAFMAMLERNGVEGARLLRLRAPRTNTVFSPEDVHFVVVIGTESFDVAARRFEPLGAVLSRRVFIFIEVLWGEVEEVDIDEVDPSPDGAHGGGIPENWRELADVEPPGEGIGWPFPGGWPVETSGNAG